MAKRHVEVRPLHFQRSFAGHLTPLLPNNWCDKDTRGRDQYGPAKGCAHVTASWLARATKPDLSLEEATALVEEVKTSEWSGMGGREMTIPRAPMAICVMEEHWAQHRDDPRYRSLFRSVARLAGRSWPWDADEPPPQQAFFARGICIIGRVDSTPYEAAPEEEKPLPYGVCALIPPLPIDLGIWTDGDMFVIASSGEDAVEVMRETLGIGYGLLGEDGTIDPDGWRLRSPSLPPLTLSKESPDDAPDTKEVFTRARIDLVGRGYIGSVNV